MQYPDLCRLVWDLRYAIRKDIPPRAMARGGIWAETIEMFTRQANYFPFSFNVLSNICTFAVFCSFWICAFIPS